MILENKNLINIFWENLDSYIQNNTVLEEIDNTFPIYFFDNFEIYQELFNNVAEQFTEYYLNVEGLKIDFNVTYGDAFRFIIKSLKDIYIQNNDILTSDIDDIIYSMFYEKYLEHIKKNEDLKNILDRVKQNIIKKNS